MPQCGIEQIAAAEFSRLQAPRLTDDSPALIPYSASQLHELKAVIPGGSAPVLPGSVMMDPDMDFDSIAKAGWMLGSGAVIVLDETHCMVRSLERLAYFYYEESCGQCTPCREGTGWLYRILHRIEHGSGAETDLNLLNSPADNIQGRTISALGDSAARPARSFGKHFRDEFEAHITHKACPVRERLG